MGPGERRPSPHTPGAPPSAESKKNGPYLTPPTKTDPRENKDPNVKDKTMKSEEKFGRLFLTSGQGRTSYTKIPKHNPYGKKQ